MSYSKNYLRKSKLVGVKMIEAYDLTKMRKILIADKSEHNLWDDDIQKMERYILSYGGKTERELTYNFGINSACEYGRLYADRSFGQMWSAVKNTVSSDDYVDIDMVNSQATIMWEMAIKDLNIDKILLPQFDYYINHRDEYIRKVMRHYDVSKRLAKLLFTSLMNGGTVWGWKQKNNIIKGYDISELDQFAAEALRIKVAFFGKRFDITSKISTSPDLKDVNTDIEFKIFSRAIKNIEALCLEKLYYRLGCPRYGSLEHDGMRVRKDLYGEEYGNFLDAYMGAAEDVLEDKDIGYVVKFDIKHPDVFLPMAEQTELDGNFELFDEKYFAQLTSYEDKKKYFEVFHFKVITPKPKYYHLCWVNQECEKLELHEWEVADIKAAFGNHTFIEMQETEKENTKGEIIKKTKPVQVSFVKRWLAKTDIRTYNRIDFIPSNKISSKLNYYNDTNEISYNSFLGYSLKCNTPIPDNADKLLKIWTDLVFELCGANNDFYNLYVNALAHKIQYPDQKSRAGCFIFKSLQGCGKNMSLTPFEILLGEYYISSSEERNFWGQYADGFYRKILINLNEMQLDKDGGDYEGKIKSFISEEWTLMNQKFKTVRKVKNTALTIMFTNKPKPFAIDFRTGERRLNVAESTNKYLSYGEEFWTGMNKIFRSDKFIAVFYDFLNKRDLTNVKWKQVKTPAYMEMGVQFVKPDELFIGDWVEKQLNYYTAMKEANLTVEMPTRFTVSDLFSKYTEFCREYNIKSDLILPKNKFITNMTELKIGITSKKSSVMVFDMNLEEVKQELIKRKLLIPDENDGATATEEIKDNRSIFDIYDGLDPNDF